MASDPLVIVLRQIAQVVSRTLELREVFAYVAEVASSVVPFDKLSVVRYKCGGELERYSFSGHDGKEPDPHITIRLEDFSPAIRPFPCKVRRFDDLDGVLDPSFLMDRKFHEAGMRSGLMVPLVRCEAQSGYVAAVSRRPHAFTDEHELALLAIADLLGLALEHERLWNLDAERRRRLDAIDELLPLLANVLDVREVFNQVSAVVKPVLAHDLLVLSSLSADRTVFTVDALSGEPAPELWAPMPVSEADLKNHAYEPVLIPDVEAEPEEDSDRCRKCRVLGVRALLKIPLRLDGGYIGSLIFLSQNPGQYSEEDIPVARRVADHVSLVLSHQRLAEEERRASEARERALLLEERVQALRDELASTRGYRRVLGESKKWKDILNQAA
jgi:GAF domain-containing protein